MPKTSLKHIFSRKIFTYFCLDYISPTFILTKTENPVGTTGLQFFKAHLNSIEMHSNLPDLFGNTKVEKRKTPSQKQFEKANLALLLAFKEIVFESFQTLHDVIFPLVQSGGMDNKMPSVSMISFIRTQIIRKFPLYCEKATKGRFKLVTPALCNIYLKKLNLRLRPSNHQSRANDLILHQLTQNNKDRGGNVFLGYVTDKKFSHIIGIFAVCLEGPNLVWKSDIMELAIRQEAKLIRMKRRGDKFKIKPDAMPIKKEQNERE